MNGMISTVMKGAQNNKLGRSHPVASAEFVVIKCGQVTQSQNNFQTTFFRLPSMPIVNPTLLFVSQYMTVFLIYAHAYSLGLTKRALVVASLRDK